MICEVVFLLGKFAQTSFVVIGENARTEELKQYEYFPTMPDWISSAWAYAQCVCLFLRAVVFLLSRLQFSSDRWLRARDGVAGVFMLIDGVAVAFIGHQSTSAYMLE